MDDPRPRWRRLLDVVGDIQSVLGFPTMVGTLTLIGLVVLLLFFAVITYVTRNLFWILPAIVVAFGLWLLVTFFRIAWSASTAESQDKGHSVRQPASPEATAAPPSTSRRLASDAPSSHGGTPPYPRHDRDISLARSLQDALTEGLTIFNRLAPPSFLPQSVVGFREPATDREIDEWLQRVRLLLRSKPTCLAEFNQEKSSTPWPYVDVPMLSMITHPRRSELQHKLDELDRIIRKLNGDEQLS